jgi:membrane protease subunit HflK
VDWKKQFPEQDEIDPSEVLRQFMKRMRAGRGKGFTLLAVVLVVLGLSTSYYQVEPDEVGVVRRFGRYSHTTEPGPYFRIPFGIDRVTKVPVQRQLKLEFGFRTTVTGSPSLYRQDRKGEVEMSRESLMLTGDLNVAVVEWIVQYKVSDPYKFLFKVRDVDETLRSLAEASMRFVVGDHSVNEVLTTGRQKIATESKELLQTLANRYETGVDIQQVVLQDVNPPDSVKPSFNEVNQAIQEKERAINEAHAEMNKEIPRAKGEAEQAVQGAEGYAIERINRAQGEAGRFARILEEYKKAPDVTRRRLYLETMAEVLPRVGQKVVVDESTRGLTPILQMGSGVSTPTAAAVKEAGR